MTLIIIPGQLSRKQEIEKGILSSMNIAGCKLADDIEGIVWSVWGYCHRMKPKPKPSEIRRILNQMEEREVIAYDYKDECYFEVKQ